MKPSLTPRHIKTDYCSLTTNDCPQLFLIVCAKRIQPIRNRPEPLTAFRNPKSPNCSSLFSVKPLHLFASFVSFTVKKIRILKSKIRNLPFVSIRFFTRNEYNLQVISPFNPLAPMLFQGSGALLGQKPLTAFRYPKFAIRNLPIVPH